MELKKMNLEIRKYTEKDLTEIIRIWNEVVDEGIAFPQEELVMDKINEAQIWVPEYEVEQKYNAMKSRFKNRLAAESIPQHIYQMEAILDTAKQKMDALEQE
ncbi:hypothetical protein [Butyrivibrio sp. MC2013]|uniref:hypothetical protein n=1 Tax=Butyrivibrio sp. MC2013 TaxID=1280686 RepID=UPI0003FE5488|nr:hypothetical protein [Butyrivibrio sp. MC2013]